MQAVVAVPAIERIIAVAADQGLRVPVVNDADRLSVAGLARAVHDVSQRARDGKLRLQDVQGGTFTVDNTGSFGSIISMPIINLGQAAILALEAITKRPVVLENDAIPVRSTVNLCLSSHHRTSDGAPAAGFLPHCPYAPEPEFRDVLLDRLV